MLRMSLSENLYKENHQYYKELFIKKFTNIILRCYKYTRKDMYICLNLHTT